MKPAPFCCTTTPPLRSPRVQYWEPTKFAQRLRAASVAAHGAGSDARVLLKTDMSSGHFSASDRYKYLKEEAFTFAWVLERLGLA